MYLCMASMDVSMFVAQLQVTIY